MLIALEHIKTVGLAGTGSVGAAWAALLLAAGYEVLAYDTETAASDRLYDAVRSAWPALKSRQSELPPTPPIERLHILATLEDMVGSSDLVQENVAEAVAVKREVISRIDAVLPPDRLILSSSGGVPPSTLQSYCLHPRRVLLGHPFHPAYLIPLVEVVAGEHTSRRAVELAMAFYRKLGKRPILLRKEVVGHLSNRLQFALLREAIHCLDQGVATAEDIDTAIRCGLGLRWALMGPLMTFNLAGGPGGIEQLIARYKDDVNHWWEALGKPTLTDQVCAGLFNGVAELRHGQSNQEWADWRDTQLTELLKFHAAHPYLTDRHPRAGNDL